MGFLMQGTVSDELGASASAVSGPVVPLQVLEQRNALFEPFQILAHGGHRSPSPNYELWAPVPRQGWWGSKKISLTLRGAGARRLAETETGSARTSVRNRTRVARRVSHGAMVSRAGRRKENAGREESKLWNQRRRVEGSGTRSGSWRCGTALSQEPCSRKYRRNA